MDRWGQDERAGAAKRPHEDVRTGYTPPAARGRQLGPPSRDDAAWRAAWARRGEPFYPRGARSDRERRRAREDTEKEYSATGKAAKDSKREASEPLECPPLRTDSVSPDRRAEEEFYRAYPDCPEGTRVHLTRFPVNLDDRSHLTRFWDLPGLTGARVRLSQSGHRFGHAEKAAYLYFGTAAQAAFAAKRIRESKRVWTALPTLRARQVRPFMTSDGMSPLC